MASSSSLTIWQYWEGPQPPYITLCMETVSANRGSAALNVCDRHDLSDLVGKTCNADLDRLTPVQRSDLFRACALAKEGGLYVDADCIAVSNLDSIFALVADSGFAIVEQPDGEPQTNFMYAERRSGIPAHLLKGIFDRLDDRSRPLAWLDLATVPLLAALNAHDGEWMEIPQRKICPIPWDNPDYFFQKGDDAALADLLDQDAVCYMLSNDTMKHREDLKFIFQQGRSQILSDSTFISFLFRKAFETI